MMSEWEQESFNDLSGTWLQRDYGDFGACVEHTGVKLNYTATIHDHSDIEIMYTVEVQGLTEAIEVAEAMALQYMLDRYHEPLATIGFHDVDP